jgi:probable addiction module antidote protein
MAVELIPFDPAEHIETLDDILYYLEAAMKGNDPEHIACALGDVARSKGMTEICAHNRAWASSTLHGAFGKWQSSFGNTYFSADRTWIGTHCSKKVA